MDARRQLARGPRPAWIKPLARMGYAARGLVYLVIAVLAIVAAVSGGENQDTRDAIQLLTRNFAGGAVAILLIVSLAGYSLWRFVQSVFDTDDHGLDPAGAMVRLGLLISCITYALLAIYAFSLWWGSGGGEGGGGDFARMFAETVGARYAAIAVASAFVVVGGAHIWKAVRRKYRPHFSAPSEMMPAIDVVAISGLVARGITFLLLGLLFYLRGLSGGDDSGQPGLKEALDYIVSLPAGSWLLAATGLGLVAFAAYSFAEAWWRRINVEGA